MGGGGERTLVPAGATTGVTGAVAGQGRQDLTYQMLADRSYRHADFTRSLFTGAVLERCVFENTCFDRCDFAGTKFVNCKFDGCTFRNAEMRSCLLSGCDFERTDLNALQWDRTQVERSSFATCTFFGASIREVNFASSALVDCRLDGASITLDNFSECQFIRTDFSDCTALFLFFDKCAFESAKINAETIGFTYGLRLEDLEALELVYLGELAEKPTDVDLPRALATSYEARKWDIGLATLQINFRRLMPALAVRDLTRKLKRLVDRTGSIDWDELQFFAGVLRRLEAEGRLSLFSTWAFSDLLRKARNRLAKEFSSAREYAPGPDHVVSQVNSLLNLQLDMLAQFLELPLGSRKPVTLRWVLKQRPKRTLAQLVPWPIFGVRAERAVVLLDARPGSWTETWQVSLSALLAIQVTLGAASGIGTQLAKISGNFKKIVSHWGREKQKAPRGAKRNRPRERVDFPFPLQLAPDAASKTRIVALSPDRLVLLDALLHRLDRLSDDQLSAFSSYDQDNVKEIELVGDRYRRPRTSASRAKPPRPASSKRSKLTRKAKP